MANLQIKPEELTLLEEYFRVMEQFDSTLSSVIDSDLGLRCKSFGYQYSEIIRSLMRNAKTYSNMLNSNSLFYGTKWTWCSWARLRCWQPSCLDSSLAILKYACAPILPLLPIPTGKTGSTGNCSPKATWNSLMRISAHSTDNHIIPNA